MSRKILDSTLESASFNIIFQLFLKCVTFFLTAFVLRYITSDVVGVMNVRLLLLESTILFLSREAFRRAALSQTESHSWPQIINLVWLTLPLSIVISVIFSFIWLNILDVPSPDITPHYTFGVWSISVSCVIETLAEPLYIASQAFFLTKFRIALVSIVISVRSIIFAVWVVFNPKQAVIAFSAAQIIANTLLTIGFYVYFYFYIHEYNQSKIENFINQSTKINTERNVNEDKDEIRDQSQSKPNLIRRQSSLVGLDDDFPFHSLSDFLPKSINDENWVHPESAHLTWSFFKQGVLKQILTEGERYIMTLFSVLSFNEQGIYDVVNNLGSLVVRFIFQPVEESLYYYFTQSIKRDVKIKDQNQDRMKEAATVLSQALKCVVGIGLVICIFGQSYSTLLLYLYGGETASSKQATMLLRTHCFSVLLLGINGITECYTFSSMTADQLNKYNYTMAVFSVAFLFISYGLTTLLGGVGFIIANCCIMSARVMNSVFFIKGRYADSSFKPLEGLMPNKYFLTTLIISFCITKITEYRCSYLLHFIIGAFCFLVVMTVWCFQEKELVYLAIEKIKSRKSKKEKIK